MATAVSIFNGVDLLSAQELHSSGTAQMEAHCGQNIYAIDSSVLVSLFSDTDI
jgi:hypothetical protein